MKDFILFALLGLGTGGLIAGLALSIVLSFRGSGVVNLAVGAYAMLGAYAYYGLRVLGVLFLPPVPFLGAKIHVGGTWPPVPAFLVALAICALAGAFFDGVVLRRLRLTSSLAKLVASLGLLLTMQAVVVLRFGSDAVPAPSVLSQSAVDVFGIPVPANRFILAAVVVAVAAALTVIYRRTKFGIATRAAQENVESAVLSGLSPQRLSLSNEVLAAIIAGALGIAVAPIAQLDPIIIAFSVIPALAAALLARFTSFPIAALAGLGIGVIQSLIIWLESKSWFPTSGGAPLPGVDSLFFFVAIVVILFVRGGSLPERGAVLEKRLPVVPRASGRLSTWMLFGLIAATAIIVSPFDYRQALINSAIGALMCLSYVVLTGFVGQMSLLQAAIAGVSALTVSKLAQHAGLGLPLAPLLAVGASLVVGLVAGASALRVRGVSLAIVTMAGALCIEKFWFTNPSWGVNESNAAVPEPKLLGLDLGPAAHFFGSSSRPSPVFGLVCLVVLGLACAGVAVLRRRQLGLRMLAVRSNERAAAAAGLAVARTKLAAYAIGSVIAGIAGTLYAYDFGTVDVQRFSLFVGLGIVAFAYLGGITSILGALIGGLLVTEGLLTHVIEHVLGLPAAYQLIFGGLALMVAIVRAPEGIAGLISAKRSTRLRLRRATSERRGAAVAGGDAA